MTTSTKKDHPEINIDQGVRAWMLSIGYVHESEIEHATSTLPRSRARWKSPAGVMFGNEKWYPLSEIKRHLEARESGPDEELAPIMLLGNPRQRKSISKARALEGRAV